jgi:hypothetical protein
MLKITIELISAITNKTETIAQAQIYNDGSGTKTKGNYKYLFLNEGKKWGEGEFKNFPRTKENVWDLIYACLNTHLKGEL